MIYVSWNWWLFSLTPLLCMNNKHLAATVSKLYVNQFCQLLLCSLTSSVFYFFFCVIKQFRFGQASTKSRTHLDTYEYP